MRINKFIAQAGVCSRREADRLILQGKVIVDERVALPGDRINQDSIVTVHGRKIENKLANEKRVILIYNKPAGLICSHSAKDGETIFDYIDYPKRLFYAGRLDRQSRGLMILTNDGKLANSLMHSKNCHEREYYVKVDPKVSDEILNKLRQGVFIRELKVKTKPCKVERIDDKSFTIILTQGLNRQIRRMCKSCNLYVTDLCRVRIENITLGKLKEGTYRKLKDIEKKGLYHAN